MNLDSKFHIFHFCHEFFVSVVVCEHEDSTIENQKDNEKAEFYEHINVEGIHIIKPIVKHTTTDGA